MMQYLSDEDYDRLQQTHPELAEGCPTCHGEKAYVYQGTTQQCDCTEQRRLYMVYSHAGIGLTYQRLGWDDLEVPDDQLGPVLNYLENAQSYINRGRGLFLSGGVGTGKTLIANLVLKDLIKRGYSCYFTTFSGMVEAFTSTWGDNEEKRRFADRFMRTKVLCLDDLGKEFRSSNRLPATTFDHVLRTRVFEARPTILTTNLSAKEVQIGYGSAVLSLLAEQSTHVHLEGQDFRTKAHYRTDDEIAAGEARPIL